MSSTENSSEIPTEISAGEMSSDEIVRIAYRHARQFKLAHEDAQDCAMDFRLHLQTIPNPQTENLGWLHRCAHNYACNYLRTQIRRSQRERTWAENYAGMEQPLTGAAQPVITVQPPGPRTLTLRKLLLEQLDHLLHQCTPAQQELFVHYHVGQQSIAELSHHTGRSPHALRQSLSQLNRRLAQQLQQHGWNRTEAMRIFFR
jgi:RNA polymerase sigma factor (sigma-70 family)